MFAELNIPVGKSGNLETNFIGRTECSLYASVDMIYGSKLSAVDLLGML